MTTPNARKQKLYSLTQKLFSSNPSFLIVSMENITATQLQTTKMNWNDGTVFLFGKNTTIKKALNDAGITCYDQFLKGNIAFIFCDDVRKTKEILVSNSRDAFAKVGAIAQEDMWIENQITGMGPDKTSFFQALGINTKITKGKVEIISRAQTLFKGQKVTPSQANLLKVMNIKPFNYYMQILAVCERGELYPPEILNISDELVDRMLTEAVQEIAAVSMATGVMNEASVNYEIMEAIRDGIKVSLGSGYKINETALFQ